MFVSLTRAIRLRAAAVLATVYALCVMAPPVSLAFTDSAAASHCLTVDHHGTADMHDASADSAHEHATGVDHDHSAAVAAEQDSIAAHKHADGSGKKSATCCGLFCLGAANAEAVDIAALPLHGIAPMPTPVAQLVGHAPSRIDRPPKLLSM